MLSNNALFGTNCPFTTAGGNNVVKMIGQGFPGTSVKYYLIFHKVQLTGDVKTGFGVVRTSSRDNIMGPYADDISDPNYNVAITDSSAIRIYGFEGFFFLTTYFYDNVMEISTTDGVNTIGLHDTETGGNTASSHEFYASYSFPALPTCPSGCFCASGSVCSSCQQHARRVASPVTVDGAAACPCYSPGFYADNSPVCSQCPMNSYCDTCEMDIDRQVKCTGCMCSQHRVLVNDQCVCDDGFTEPTPAGAYCVKV